MTDAEMIAAVGGGLWGSKRHLAVVVRNDLWQTDRQTDGRTLYTVGPAYNRWLSGTLERLVLVYYRRMWRNSGVDRISRYRWT